MIVWSSSVSCVSPISTSTKMSFLINSSSQSTHVGRFSRCLNSQVCIPFGCLLNEADGRVRRRFNCGHISACVTSSTHDTRSNRQEELTDRRSIGERMEDWNDGPPMDRSVVVNGRFSFATKPTKGSEGIHPETMRLNR